MKQLKIFGGYQSTKGKEDFALTPYLALVYVNNSYQLYGLSLTWGYLTIFIAIGNKLPKPFKRFAKY
jgi:hypothetical protein